jgi:hypothetical protein
MHQGLIRQKGHFKNVLKLDVCDPMSDGSLSRSPDWRNPSKQEKVVAAKRAAIGQKNPEKRLLDGVSNANAPKIDRFAMRTACGKHSSSASFLNGSFRRAASASALAVPERWCRVPYAGLVATASCRAACFPGGLNLFWSPQVRLGELHTLFGTGNLSLMSFC